MCIKLHTQKKCVNHRWSILFSHCSFRSGCRCSVSFRGMFVQSNTDLWDWLGALFSNELWIIGMRDDFLLRLAKYYYMAQTFNLIGGQDVSSRPVISIQVTEITRIRSFIYGLLLQIQLLFFSLSRTRKEQVCKLQWRKSVMHIVQSAPESLCLMYRVWNWNIPKRIGRIYNWIRYFNVPPAPPIQIYLQ